ncbi:MAG: VOC family protein [Hyphomicrobiales bacterium]|nr:VOC family protein [Hyphomicrobiales bacterium]
MIKDLKAQTVVPVADLKKAVHWYEGTLGFDPGQRFGGGVFYNAGDGTQFQLYETPNAGKNPATLMGFLTSDIVADVRDLKARGIVFEEYDVPGLKTVESIADSDGARAAWFKDPDGNILGFLQLSD